MLTTLQSMRSKQTRLHLVLNDCVGDSITCPNVDERRCLTGGVLSMLMSSDFKMLGTC
jgi:hypothetical protein